MYSYQNKKNIHNYYSSHSLIVHMVVAMIYKYVITFLNPYLLLLLLASNLAGHIFLPFRVTQIFIPEVSGPLIGLSVVFHYFILL